MKLLSIILQAQSGGDYTFLIIIVLIVLFVLLVNNKKKGQTSTAENMKPGYISQNTYAKTKLYPALTGVGGVFMLNLILHSSEGSFVHFIYELILIPGIIFLSIFSLKYFVDYYKVKRIPENEWEEYIKKERILLSLAIYLHPLTGDIQTVRRGFSLPVFLFGGFVPLVRRQWGLALKFWGIIFGLNLLGSIIPVIGNIIAHILGSFGIARRYNEYYEDWLNAQGYILQDAHGIFNDISNVNEVRKVLVNSNNMTEAYSNAKNQLLSNRTSTITTSDDKQEEVYDEKILPSKTSIECKFCKTMNSSEDLFCYNCGESLLQEEVIDQ